MRAYRIAMRVTIASFIVLILTPLSATAQSIAGFTLVNADTNQPVAGYDPLPEGAVIDLAKLPTRRLNIRATTWPGVVGSVRFGLNSAATYHVENVAPYALAGDSAGNYFPWTPPIGSHAVTATPYTGSHGTGTAGAALRRTFHVVDSATQQATTTSSTSDPTSSLAVTSLTLLDASTGQPLPGYDPLADGAALDLASLPTGVAIRANTSPSVVGSVVFGYNGDMSYRTENVAPYALHGDTNGTYQPWSPQPGTYEVMATAYSGTNATGSKGATLVRRFSVHHSTSTTGDSIPLAVTSLTLLDASTGQPIPGYDPLPDGSILNLAALPPAVAIRANTSPSVVGSIVFGYNGNTSYRTENVAPYALHGDTNGTYQPWSPQPGTHEVTATAYSGTNATGSKSAMLVRQFTVEQSTSTSTPSPAPPASAPAQVSGELRTWHRVTLTFDGPMTNEDAWPNPFRDYRLNVTFTNGSRRYVVPGYYAADGNAAETSARGGNKWRVHFVPDATGTWTYSASFRAGADVAMSLDPLAGVPTSFDGTSGEFSVAPTDKSGRDHRAKGRLQYVGRHHLRFAGTGEYFLKGGADSPENFLGYWEFDNTFDTGGLSGGVLHRYAPHVTDWRTGDPTWQAGKGKGIIGALNYLAGAGMNSVYFLTYNTDGGDGSDTWPWTTPTTRDRYDVSKLEQWEIVFSHMGRLGIKMHVVTQEEENDQVLDGGALGPLRKLYYRELVARFGHHLALQWNLGEENSNTSAQRKSFADYIRAIDPYRHPIVFHAQWNQAEMNYADTFGHPSFEAASVHGDAENYNQNAINLRRSSSLAGRPWAIHGDEQTPAVASDMSNVATLRKTALWGNLMGGGAGVEWYFGYQGTFGDVQSEDWRIAQPLWDQTRHALSFFHTYLPFELMEPRNNLVSGANGALALAYVGHVYAVYLPSGGSPSLNLDPAAGTYDVFWYNPRTGGALHTGPIATVASGIQSLGPPPFDQTDDWVVLISRHP